MKKMKLVAVGLIAALLLAGCGAKSAAESEPNAQAEHNNITLRDLEDGVYSAEFVTDSSMFHANESCDGKGTLTIRDGQAIFHVSLVSKNILNLYSGLAADAENDGQNWLQPTEDMVTYSDGYSETVYGFDIPVDTIGEDFDLAILGKKGIWYDHKVRVQNPEPVLGADVTAVESVTDGTYTCEVTLQGGSGRATVESPARVHVIDGVMTATIVWSSSNYEYMLVDGVQYDPVQTEGNSTFEIPVVMDADLAVSANNLAMSVPHLIDYTLHFDSATLIGVEE